MTMFYRYFQKFLILERGDRLRHHTEIPRMPTTANAGKCAFLPVRAISKNRSRPGVESGLLRIIFEKTPGAEITPGEIRRGATRLRARNAPIHNRGSSVFRGTRGRLRKGGSSTAPRRVTLSLLSSSHPKFTNPPLALYSLSCRWSFTHNTRRPGNITRGARGDPTCLTR